MRDADKLRASAIEAATCDRFGNPVLSLGPKTVVGRALAAQEDFQHRRLPAFARFRDADRLSTSASQSPHRSEEGYTPIQNPAQGFSRPWRLFEWYFGNSKAKYIIDPEMILTEGPAAYGASHYKL